MELDARTARAFVRALDAASGRLGAAGIEAQEADYETPLPENVICMACARPRALVTASQKHSSICPRWVDELLKMEGW